MPLISRGLQMSFFETFDRALKDIGYDGLCFEIDRLGDTARLGKKIAPGSAIAVSLIDGDMNLYSLCAVTAISDGKFSTCGHFFSGAGRVNLPVMSASVSDNGFFLKDTYRASNVLEPFGKITKDCGLFAFGELGVFYDFTQMSVYLENTSYNYRVSKDKKGMPVYVSMALSNALNGSSWKNFEIGECCIDVRLHVKNRETVFFVRKFSERGAELRKKIINQFLSDMSVLLNKYINFSDLEKIEFDVKQRKSLGSLELKKIKTEPIPAASGDNLKIDLIFKSIDDCDKVSSVNISLPENLPEGCYDLFACSRSASFDIENTFHGEKNDKINASIIDNLILKSRDDEVFIYLKKKAYSNKTEANRHDALPFISAILFKKIESSLFKVGRYRLPAIVSGALNSEIFINNKYENNNN